MRKLLTILFLFSFVYSFGQSISRRSNGMVTVVDSNLFAGNSFRVPIFVDTNAANNNRPSLDSAGKVIFTRNTNWFWGRQTYPTRQWVQFNAPSGQTGLTPICGSAFGTHLVTWDSSLTFDVSGGPYVLCCDLIPRSINNTSITLDSNSSAFQRIDLIILDSNGVNKVEGTPSLNPSTPTAPTCSIILSYILINGHSNVPAFISGTNPLIIYDENYNTEWRLDSTNNLTVDTANTVFPLHLTHSIKISNYLQIGPFIELKSPSPVDLNTYGVLKFYLRKTGVIPFVLTLSFFLNGVQQTLPLQAQAPNGFNSYYLTYSIPLSSLVILNNGSTLVNQLRITINNQTSSDPFYLDWIQLQSGIPIVNNTTSVGGTGTLTGFGMGTLDSLLTPSIANSTTSPNVTFSKYSVPQYTILGNSTNATAPYTWTQVNLGTSMVTGSLPITNISTSGAPNNSVLTNVSGTPTWVTPATDTSFLTNGLHRYPVTGSNNDTLVWGARNRDSSKLLFNTFIGLNSLSATFTQGTSNVFQINTSGWLVGDGIMPTSGSGGTDSAAFRNHTTGQWYLAPASASGTVTAAGNGLTDSSGRVIIQGQFYKNTIDTLNTFSWTLNSANTINSGTNSSLVFTANSLTSGEGFYLSSNSLAGGTIVDISVNTTAAASNTQKGLNINLQGANSNNNQTSYGLYVTNSHSGTGNLNYGILSQVSNEGSTSVALKGVASGGGEGLDASSNSGYGANIFSTSGPGAQITSSSNSALLASSSSGNAANFTVQPSSTNTVIQNSQFTRLVSGTPTDGVGESVDFVLEDAGTFQSTANQIISKLTSSAHATKTSQLIFTGINNGGSLDNLLAMGDRVNLTESSATTFATTTVASGKIGGGEIIVTIEANDGTDYQSRTQRIIWTAENKAGTTTITLGTPEEVVAASTGTLTSTITAVDAGSGVIQFKSNAVSSLTQTVLRATYFIQKNF